MRIVKPSLHEACGDRIRDKISAGVLAPGERIPERELCQEFGVSRTPLREALKALAAEGLVELSPNRGAHVSRLDRGDIEEVFEVMAGLEAMAGELACQRISEAELADIRGLHYEMRAHYERGDLPEYFRCNQRIHESIIDAARNTTLQRLHQSLAGRLQRARYVANLSGQRWAGAITEHERILDALVARDGERLSELLRGHLRHKLDAVIEARFTTDGDGEAEAGDD